MNIWKILQTDKTTDKSAIKKAYRIRLKVTHPEDAPEEFMQLRDAYEKALEYAENSYEYEDIFEEEETSADADWNKNEEQWSDEYNDDWDKDDYDESEDNLRYEVNNYEMRNRIIQREVSAWWHRVSLVWNDYNKRCDIEEWRRLLYDDIPYKLAYFDKCRERLNEFLFNNNKEPRYMPNDIWKMLDKFFGISPDKLEVVSYDVREKNKKIKLCEMIDFSKAIVADVTDVDDFFKAYERMAELMIVCEDEEDNDWNWEEINNILIPKLDSYDITYLPYECTRLALQFDTLTDDEINKEIDRLTTLFGNVRELELLEAQYKLFSGEKIQAEKLLKELYMTVPAKNYPHIFQLAVCCEHVEMYFEAYMLIKQLMWLKPNEYLEKKAEEIYNKMEKAYIYKLEKGYEITDLERIQMCRMYLRSNREKDAARVLKDVKQIEAHEWHYHMARCLVYFNEEDISPMTSSWTALSQYNKDRLNSIERLEWEELKARYYFEQKDYKSCIDKCNELLEEYPVSAVILLLREYADCSYDDIHYKRYYCLQYLKNVIPKRAELYYIFVKHTSNLKAGRSDNITCELLEEVKDKCFLHYEYERIMSQYDYKSDEAKREWITLFKKIKKQEVYLPAISKYNCLDLRIMYRKAASSLWRKYDRKIYDELYRLLISLKKSKYNQPEKYASLMDLYSKTHEHQKFIKEALKRLKVEKDDFEVYRIYDRLIVAYGDIGDIKQVDKLWAQLEKRGLPPKTWDIYHLLYQSIFLAYVDGVKVYSEEIYKKADSYCDICCKLAENLDDYYQMYCFYECWGVATGDNNIFLKGVAVLRQSLEVFGKIGDMVSQNKSIYLLIGRLYALCGMEKEAMAAIEDMRRYSKNDDVKRASYMYIAEIYEELGHFEVAKEDYHKAEENGSRVITKLLRCYLKNGDYKEAREILMRDPDADDYVYAVHTKYMESGSYDMSEISEIKERLESDIKQRVQDDNIDDDVGCYYTRLVEMCNILGEKENEEYYRGILKEFKWNEHSHKCSDTIKTELWILWYRKDYDKAWKLLQDNRESLVCGNIEMNMFEYLLGKMYN